MSLRWSIAISGSPVVAVRRERAGEHLGFLGDLLALDSPASSALTRELLAWQPTRPGLVADPDEGHYFRTRSA